MGTDTAPCEQCRTEIDIDAATCPQCGFDPQANGRLMRKVFLVGGFFLTLSIIGAPLGIPMLLLWYVADRQVKKQQPAAV
jgi:hypothetical protein